MKRLELIGVALLVAVCLGFGVVALRLNQPAVPAEPGVTIQAVRAAGELNVETLALATICSTGECSGFVTTTNALVGELVAVYVDYAAAVAGISDTMDFTMSYTSPWSGNLLIVDDYSTDVLTFPMAIPVSYVQAVIAGGVPFPLNGRLAVNVAQTMSGTVGAMYIWYRRP